MSGIDLALRQAVARLRRRRTNRVLLEGLVKVVAAVFLAVLIAAILTATLGSGSNAVVTARVIGYLLIAAALITYLFVPLFRRPRPAPGQRPVTPIGSCLSSGRRPPSGTGRGPP